MAQIQPHKWSLITYILRTRTIFGSHADFDSFTVTTSNDILSFGDFIRYVYDIWISTLSLNWLSTSIPLDILQIYYSKSMINSFEFQIFWIYFLENHWTLFCICLHEMNGCEKNSFGLNWTVATKSFSNVFQYNCANFQAILKRIRIWRNNFICRI